MGWCKVGENEGAKAIADLILFNTSIATLDLRGNSLNNPGWAPASHPSGSFCCSSCAASFKHSLFFRSSTLQKAKIAAKIWSRRSAI